MEDVLISTEMQGLIPDRKGKVRDIFFTDEGLILVATDRLSAYDVVFSEGIPGKGKILTQMTLFWFEHLSHIIENHFLSDCVEKYPPPFNGYLQALQHRSMLVKKTEVIPIECVVRGYLAGSGWQEYIVNGSVCGIPLPDGLLESGKLDEPIFTPATKAEQGAHDENISFQKMEAIIGEDLAKKLKETSLMLYQEASEYALARGIIIADTKFEFGLGKDGRIILIDEIFTPDSSRFWFIRDYVPGRPQLSLDKQFVRDYLNSTHWDRTPPPPSLPSEVVQKTAEKYTEAFKLLTDREDNFLT